MRLLIFGCRVAVSDVGPLCSFEFTIGDDVIPYFLGKQCFDDIVSEIVKIGEARKFDKLFIGCDENIR